MLQISDIITWEYCSLSLAGKMHLTVFNVLSTWHEKTWTSNVIISISLFDVEASVVQALTNITVIEGENSNLTCHVSGTPMPSVSWTEVRTGDHTEGNTRALVNVSRSDAGEYKCEASNFCGNDSKSTFLIVNCKWLLSIVNKSTCIIPVLFYVQ